jgi:hypothetical protein
VSIRLPNTTFQDTPSGRATWGRAVVDALRGLAAASGVGGGGTTTEALTINNGGAGAASGATFNGSAPVTISYNTVGAAPSGHNHAGVYEPADATLTALAAYNTNGVICQTAADTFAGRTLTAPAAGLTITNPAGIAGNPTFALADDLAAIEALSGTNTIYYRSGASTWTGVTVGTGLSFSGGTLSATGGGFEASPTIPDTSGYTLQNTGTASMANASNGRGIVLTVPTAADTVRFVRKNGAPPATPYSVTVRAMPVSNRHGGTSRMCVVLRNSTSGRLITFGKQDDFNLYAQRWAAYSTGGGNILLQGGVFSRVLPWLRISNDGTTLTFQCSPDGDNWFTYTTEALATYITATGGSVDEVGFGTTTQNAGFTVVDLFQSCTVA